MLALVGLAVLELLLLLVDHRTFFAAPDNTTQFFAWYQKSAAVLHSGSFPLWDQSIFSGHSFVGETQTGVFYPLNLVWLLVLGGAQGIGPHRLDALMVVHLLIASTGFYALARSFGAGRLAAVLAGVVFAYTGVIFSRAGGQSAIFFGLTLVPWTVFFAHRQLETGKLRFAAASGVFLGLGVLAGHFEPPFHAAVLVLLLYALTRPAAELGWRSVLRPRGLGLGITFGAAILVALPQLSYSLPYLNRAYRFVGPGPPVAPGGKITFQTFSQAYSGAPDSLLNLLDPQRYSIADGNDLFIGLAALVVLLVVGFTSRTRIVSRLGRYRRPLLAALVIGALAMLGAWTPFAAVLYEIPFVSEVRQLARYAIMVHVVLCLLLALGIDEWLRRGSSDLARAPRRWLWPIAGSLAVLEGIYLILRPLSGDDHWFGIQIVLAGFTLLTLAAWGRLGRRVGLVLLAGLLIASSLHNGLRTLGSTSSPFYPPHYYARTPLITYSQHACAPHRTLVLNSALPVNAGEVFPGLRTQNGYGATMLVAYYDFINSSSVTSPEQLRLLDLGCVVSTSPLTLPGYRLGFQEGGVRVYIDRATSPLNSVALQPIPVTSYEVQDRRLRYRFQLKRTTSLVVSAVIYPGWNLTLDGHRVTAGAFRVGGIPVFPELTVGPGLHTLQYSWSGWPA